MLKEDKKGAIELSIGTIVIIVLAMAMLILGLVLVQKIFTGATEATELVNDNVKAQINKLFNDEGTKTVIYLPNNQADIKKGNSYYIRFAIRNTNTGGSGDSVAFNYEFTVSSKEGAGVQEGCKLTPEQAQKFIQVGRSGTVSLRPGDPAVDRQLVIQAPDDSPLCKILYDLKVWTTDKQNVYDTNFFIVRVV